MPAPAVTVTGADDDPVHTDAELLLKVNTGGAVTENGVADDAVPPAVTTVTVPETPAGTVAVICVAVFVVVATAVPPIVNVALVNEVPVIVISPDAAQYVAGVNDVITGVPAANTFTV